jgi:hypothetical protein
MGMRKMNAIIPIGKALNAKFLNRLLVGTIIAALSACSAFDLYGEKFKTIAIGNSTVSVIATLGEPDFISSIEWPLIKIEQLAWRSRISGRVYTVVTVLDRVAGKTIIQ